MTAYLALPGRFPLAGKERPSLRRRIASMMNLWIDTDIGDDIDDAVALLAAARHPGLRLVGISTVYGSVEIRAWLARELLTRAGISVPILPGCMQPMTGREISPAKWSYNTLAPDLLPLSPGDDDARVDAIAEAMHQVNEPFHLVTIGAMTNAAKLITRRPSLARQWQSVTCMAGRLEGDPEWNVYCDPSAAKAVLRELAPRLVGLEACSDVMPKSKVERLADPADPASVFFLECYHAYRNARETPNDEAPLTLFDPISLLSLVVPEAFDLQQVKVAIDREGRLRLTDDGFAVTYALSNDWSKLEPVIEAVLRNVW